MNINRRVSHSQIKRRVLRKLSIAHPELQLSFYTVTQYPVKHRFYIDGYDTRFYFTYQTVLELLDHSSMTGDPYEFVIETIYYSCLKEIKIALDYE